MRVTDQESGQQPQSPVFVDPSGRRRKVLVQSTVTAVAGARLPWQKLRRAGQAAADSPVRAAS